MSFIRGSTVLYTCSVTMPCTCADGGSSSSDGCLPDQRVWSVRECADVFQLR